MNIGIVSYILNPKSGARAPIEIAKGLSKRNKVTFYAIRTRSDKGASRLLIQHGVEVVLLDKLNAPLKLLVLLKKENHEVLSTHTTLSLLLAAVVSGTPTINTYYGTQFNVLDERYPERTSSAYLDGGLITSLVNKILNLIIYAKGFLLVRLPKEVIGISKYTADEAKRLYGRECGFVYLGNAPKHFVKPKNKSESKRVKILSVSRITPYKQFEKIIGAVKKLRGKVELTIIGSSPQPKYLDYLQSIKGLRTKILTDLPDRKLIESYSGSDIYVTADKYLFFGMPILEAASFRKPAIALDFCAARELIKHGETGYVAKTDEEFEKYLKKLIENRKLRTKMGRAAKSRAGKFSWDKTAKEYENFFGKLRR